jgi:hypothetical protein
MMTVPASMRRAGACVCLLVLIALSGACERNPMEPPVSAERSNPALGGYLGPNNFTGDEDQTAPSSGPQGQDSTVTVEGWT